VNGEFLTGVGEFRVAALESRGVRMPAEDDIATLLAKRYLSRREVKAVQMSDGSYRPDRTSWKMGDLRGHIRGDVSLGHYMVNDEGRCRLVAFDIDLDKTATDEDGNPFEPRKVWLGEDSALQRQLRKEMRSLGEGIALRAKRMVDIPFAVAYSGGKGVHVYGYTGDIAAAEARAITQLLMTTGPYEAIRGNNFWKHTVSYSAFTIETFPKQDSVRTDGGLGNLMRLPLGKNMKTGHRAFFLNSTAALGEFVELDALQALQDGTV
jgi:hypothetical protein